jgi:hypothetical protein
VREFLSDHKIPFEDRNIRRDVSARAELTGRGGEFVVPQLYWGAHHIVGFDPEALTDLVHEYRERSR